MKQGQQDKLNPEHDELHVFIKWDGSLMDYKKLFLFVPHLFGGQDALDDRYSIRSSLPRSGPGSSQKVFPLQSQRDGLLLDQRGLGPTQICNRLQHDKQKT